MLEEDSMVSISPDDLLILSATKDDVILRGSYYNGDDFSTCILYITRTLFHEALDEWLNRKQDYSELWNGEFCGVGAIYFEGLTERPDGAHLLQALAEPEKNDSDFAWGTMVDVRSFTASSFSVDMEHG